MHGTDPIELLRELLLPATWWFLGAVLADPRPPLTPPRTAATVLGLVACGVAGVALAIVLDQLAGPGA